MEYELKIWCVECTVRLRMNDKYRIRSFESLTTAVQHITQYGHEVKIELEAKSEEK